MIDYHVINEYKVLLKAFSVNNIPIDKVERDKIEFYNKDFLHILLSTLREAGKDLVNKKLDLLISITPISL